MCSASSRNSHNRALSRSVRSARPRAGEDASARNCFVCHSSLFLTLHRFCLLMSVVWFGGCAQPEGVLFPVLEPPHVWPAAPERPRIKLIGTLATSADLRASVSSAEVFKAAFRGPRPSIGFSSPHGVAVRGSDTIAIADSAGGAVHIVNLAARTHVMVSGFDNVIFMTPVGVVWVGNRLFVTDASFADQIGRAHQECFADIRPACTLVEVSALIEPELLVEIEATAIVSEPD